MTLKDLNQKSVSRVQVNACARKDILAVDATSVRQDGLGILTASNVCALRKVLDLLSVMNRVDSATAFLSMVVKCVTIAVQATTATQTAMVRRGANCVS